MENIYLKYEKLSKNLILQAVFLFTILRLYFIIHLRVPPYSPTWGSYHRVLAQGPTLGSHQKVLSPTFPAYRFRRVEEEQLSQWNRRNTVLRAVVKYHKDLKGTKVFAFGCSVRNLKNLQKPLLESFCCKVAAWNSL